MASSHTREQFLQGQALHAIDRLRDHIDRLDKGIQYAVDDIAVVLRLLAHPGRGNNVLHRLQELHSSSPPVLVVTAPPDVESSLFSVGAMPGRDRALEDGATRMPLDEWFASPCMTVKVANRRKIWTWAEFINDYANKWGGAHLDPVVPVELPIVDSYSFGGYSLSAYMLRTAGVAVWRSAQRIWADAVFRRSGRPLGPQELERARVTSRSGQSDPQDRLVFGEPQRLSYSGDAVDLLIYYSRTASCSATIAVGSKLSYDMTIAPPGVAEVAHETVRARNPTIPALSVDDFSQGRTVRMDVQAIAID